MESVKKTQKRFLDAAKRETRGIIKATKQITTIPKFLPNLSHTFSLKSTNERKRLFGLKKKK